MIVYNKQDQARISQRWDTIQTTKTDLKNYRNITFASMLLMYWNKSLEKYGSALRQLICLCFRNKNSYFSNSCCLHLFFSILNVVGGDNDRDL